MGADEETFAGAARAERGYGGSSSNGPKGLRERRNSLEPFTKGNSAILTAGILIADVVGAGVLSMGTAIAQLGWLLGTIVILVLLAMNVHISLLLWRVRMGCPATYTYSDLAVAAFAQAPEWQRNMAELVTNATQNIFIFCTLALYTLSVGKGLGGLFYGELRLCIYALTAIGLLLLLPFHVTSRTMGKWQFLILLNVLSIAGTVLIPLVHMAGRGVEQTRPQGAVIHAVEHLTFSGVLTGLQVMSFAFTSQFMLVEIIGEMRDPKELPKAYYISVPFQGLMFIICGVGGYYYMGSSVSGMIHNAIPFGPVFRCAAICLLVHMLITYLIKGVVFCRNVQSYMDPKGVNDDSFRGWIGWSIVVIAVMVAAWLLAEIIPFFSDFVDLLGATVTPMSCYIIPIVLYIRWTQDAGAKEDQVGKLEWAVIMAELALSIFIITVGTYFAFVKIVRHWTTYGPPFSCHCENLWNVCECSPHHAGMEQCLAGLS